MQQTPEPTQARNGAYMALPVFPGWVVDSGYTDATANRLSVHVIRAAIALCVTSLCVIIFDIVYAVETNDSDTNGIIAWGIVDAIIELLYLWVVLRGVKLRNPECMCGAGYLDVFFWLSMVSCVFALIFTLVYVDDMADGDSIGIRIFVVNLISFILYGIAVMLTKNLLNYLRMTDMDMTARRVPATVVVTTHGYPAGAAVAAPPPGANYAVHPQQPPPNFMQTSPHNAGTSLPVQAPPPVHPQQGGGGTYAAVNKPYPNA